MRVPLGNACKEGEEKTEEEVSSLVHLLVSELIV